MGSVSFDSEVDVEAAGPLAAAAGTEAGEGVVGWGNGGMVKPWADEPSSSLAREEAASHSVTSEQMKRQVDSKDKKDRQDRHSPCLSYSCSCFNKSASISSTSPKYSAP